MKKLLLAAAASLAFLGSGAAYADELADAVAEDYGYVFNLYKHFHKNPELSFKESESAKRMAAELEGLGFTVTTGVGDKWTKSKAKKDAGEVGDGVAGYGLVAVMENGEGPTVMLRADMDALPLEEKTGLPYASKVTMTDYLGQEAPVMHACAHDSHMAIMIGTARRLAAMKDQWSGTLVIIGQPAEEIGLGALAMIEDGLFKKFPKPDYILATHTSGWDAAGDVTYTPGWALANVDSVDIIIHGVGAHGSAPQMGKDPIVIGAQIVNALQTLVSRELDPQSAGVVTVGAFQAGYKHNIIPDEAHLQLTVRSYEDGVREKLLTGIERIAVAQAKSAGLPDDLMPDVKIESDYTPATYNDEAMTDRVMTAIADSIGAERVYARPASMGGEDFSRFGRTPEDIPALIFWTGAQDPKALKAAAEGKAPPPPANHSPFFAPQPEPALKTGVQAMTAGALELLGKN
ncbi:amidohydrolase [Hyphococcus luteus]|uniref:Amidohydrolase n=1 Tax=Hyphococcus luteus TaxID=2058213 RepID=A0A2S7JZ00_9PROT|nr:amidohydrolase [Marinicaulis flavus]PQA85472.1 amidohydrolase [Marinicaulis flavus]